MLHPYYPRELVLDHYIPNTNSVFASLTHVLLAFSSIVFISIGISYPKRYSTLNSLSKQLTFFWFVLCGLIHVIFEGYFVTHHATLAGESTPVAQVWKEYALSDSRYLSSDNLVLTMETITCIIWGPLALFCAWSMYNDSPWRHITQLVLSLGQIYGCTLYYFTSIVAGSPECHPDPYYYYFYFWFFNIFWMIAPIILIRDSIRVLSSAMEFSNKIHFGNEKED